MLAHRDVAGSLFYLLPGAAALVAGMARSEPALRAGLVLVGAIFLMMGLRTALPPLLRSAATLRRMRFGFLTLGRIVSCHLAWDSKRKEMPYREFLENWAVKVGQSQMGKATGCFGTVFIAVFVAPLALMMLIVALVYIAGLLNVSIGEPMAADLDGRYLAKWFAMGLVFIAAVLVFLYLGRRHAEKSVVPYMEWRRLVNPGKNDVYDEHAMRLVELAKERGEQISLKVPLPESDAGVELICRLEYSVMGEPCIAVGRARLTNRLDPAGVERIMFHPLARGKVDLLAGLPDEPLIDAQGRWSDVPASGPAVRLALTGAAAVVAIAALLGNVPQLYAMLNQP